MIDQSIFREYDIRGIVPQQLNLSSIDAIANAIAAKCIAEGVNEIALGRDGRLSGPDIMDVLSIGLKERGIKIINVGLVTSPLLYFAAQKIASKSGVMITGSHNPKNYNGFKVVINDYPISGRELLGLVDNEVPNAEIFGTEFHQKDLMSSYIS
jgi:phosphomannomutase/phosphoglucomutase